MSDSEYERESDSDSEERERERQRQRQRQAPGVFHLPPVQIQVLSATVCNCVAVCRTGPVKRKEKLAPL